MVQTLKETHKKGDFITPDYIGREIYLKMKNLRDFDEEKFKLPWKVGKNERRSETFFKEYLEFLALSELKSSGYILHTGIEKFSLMKIVYTGLENLVSDESIWKDIPKIRILTSENRYDLLRGILDEIRWWGAINHDFLNKTQIKWGDWTDHIEDYFMQDTAKLRSRKFSTPYSTLNKFLRDFIEIS